MDMIQAVHYFHIKGLGANWTARNVELLRFTLFTAALVGRQRYRGRMELVYVQIFRQDFFYFLLGAGAGLELPD